ncbi:transcriptional regulator RcsA [Edaphovirga cremea]|uniref:transcriptional regulator RcsA n=1 Tax=Edaphovirga cremea TaxID=2267246 RepID=UPI000DEEDEBA|nr:transcriptional regulator RcsA [Edaphovirga cremea]
MSAIIVDACHFTCLALYTHIVNQGIKEKDISLLTETTLLNASMVKMMPRIVFINEDCFTGGSGETAALKRIIDGFRETLFVIFIANENFNYHEFISVRENIVIISKSINKDTLECLMMQGLRTRVKKSDNERIDLTPLTLSRSEADVLNMWMAGHDTITISDIMQIKRKTVSSHKGNIKRKVKTHNKQVIYHVKKLVDKLTNGIHVNVYY